MIDPNALLALKDAWHGAIAASDRLRELAPAVEQLGDAEPTAADLTRITRPRWRRRTRRKRSEAWWKDSES